MVRLPFWKQRITINGVTNTGMKRMATTANIVEAKNKLKAHRMIFINILMPKGDASHGARIPNKQYYYEKI
jgi:hypothetical protein